MEYNNTHRQCKDKSIENVIVGESFWKIVGLDIFKKTKVAPGFKITYDELFKYIGSNETRCG